MARQNRSWPWHRAALGTGVLLGVMGLGPSAGATVAEQRARLPPAAECEDDVEGIWRAHQFWDWRFQWYVMTLEIHRVKKGEPALTGTVLSEYWNGTAKDQEAPPCAQQPYHYVVRMPAVGTYRDGDVAFGGTSWKLERAPCGNRMSGGYNPDKFTGKIDPKIQEFQSVNNDGGAAVNVATVFRRVHCFDTPDAAVPIVDVKPPSFRPKSKKGGGCGCELGPGAAGDGLLVGAVGLCVIAGAGRRRRR